MRQHKRRLKEGYRFCTVRVRNPGGSQRFPSAENIIIGQTGHINLSGERTVFNTVL